MLHHLKHPYGSWRGWVSWAAALILTFNTLLFFPSELLVALVVFGPLYFFIGGEKALLVSVSLLAATVLLEGGLRATGLADAIYYRPQERFSLYDEDRGHGRYAPNVRYEGLVPHGDLAMMDPRVEPEPRWVEFITDNLGFRNRHSYQG